MRALAAIALVLLAGCQAPAAEVEALQVVDFPLKMTCKPDSYAVRPAVCATTLGRNGDTWAEPNIAANPDQHGVVAVIVQGIAAPAEEQPTDRIPLLPKDPASTCTEPGLCMFITDDDGQTWSRRDVNGDGRPWFGGDPTAGFTKNHLLVAGLVDQGSDGIAVQRSADLGLTWQRATVLTDSGAADRPWLGIHGEEAMIVWHTKGGDTGHWVLSRDAGATWSAPQPLPCTTPSEPVWHEDLWQVACRAEGQTHLIDVVEGRRIAAFAQASGTLHLAAGAGNLWLARPGSSPTVHVINAEVTAIGTYPLATPIAQETRRSFITAVEAAPGGGFLALMSVSDGSCVVACDEDPPVHLVHIGEGRQTISALQITPVAGERRIDSGEFVRGGEFHSIACAYTCQVAWMSDGLVDIAWL